MIRNGQMKTVSIHAIAWALFITYEVLVTIVMGGKFYFRDYVFFYTLNICLFYFNADVVFRYASNLKNIAFVIVPLVILELTVYVILGETFNHILNEDPKGWSAFWNDALKALWRAIYFVGLSTGYWFFKRTIVKTKEANKFKILQLETEATKMQIEKDLAVSRVEYLQSQINPHFLFNTLNYIYNSVEKIAPDASNSILLLSEIMHYALSEIGE